MSLSKYNLDDPATVSVIDELSLWSAPFGLKLLDQIHYKQNIAALDIGFGTGFPLIELAMRLGHSSKVYGIDPWEEGFYRTVQKIKSCGISNIEIIRGCAEEMNFNDNFFNLIVSNNGLNNVADPEKVLLQCNRVAKRNAQLVFTFNTDNSFSEFYNVYREVLRDNNLTEYLEKITAHIYSKRKPLSEVKDLLEKSGFRISNIIEDKFFYRFTDGTAMFHHFMIGLAFMEPWLNILPPDLQKKIFLLIENRLNSKGAQENGIIMQVPFVTIDCFKERSIKP